MTFNHIKQFIILACHRDVNLLEGEHLKAPYLKVFHTFELKYVKRSVKRSFFNDQINPEHTIPTLIDGEFTLWDSHAICAYLIDNYAKDDKLYPKDSKLRAKVNQRMFFDAGNLFPRIGACTVPIIYKGASEVSPDAVDAIYASLDILESLLATDPFLAGNHLTIADIHVATTVISGELYAPLKADKHPKMLAWFKRLRQTVPEFDEVNAHIVPKFNGLILDVWEKNKQKK